MEPGLSAKNELQPETPLKGWRTITPRVPDHELLRRIGEGSYGEVWLARNLVGTLRAVKVVYRDRFKDERPYEREFSGIQKYEPISRSNEGLVDVLQIGRNDAEHYFYYVMELADDAGLAGPESRADQGVSPSVESYVPKTLAQQIRPYRRLSVQECITLGLNLNLALGHLHRNGLIHRDVKPSNIIFVNGVPKLADIGLVTEMAEAQSFVGTEGFIPPEGPNSPQADIYALGKVLYEASMAKDRREFPEPYSNLGTDEDSRALMELNAVLLKACAPNPRQRYQSAEEMNADLALLHSGESVRQKQQLERRLKLATRALLALAVFFVLGAFPYGLALKEKSKATAAAKSEAEQRQKAVNLQKRAEAEAAKSRAVAEVLGNMLEGVGPAVALGRDTTVLKEILDQTVAGLSTNFVDQPEVEVELRNILGRVYLDLGEADKSEEMFRRGVAVLQKSGQTNSDKLLETTTGLVHALTRQGKLVEAEKTALEALKGLETSSNTNLELKARLLNALGWCLLNQQRYPESENNYRRALKLVETGGEDRPIIIETLNNLAVVLQMQGNFSESGPLQQRVLNFMKRIGPEDDNLARATDNLAKVLAAQGQFAQAEDLMREALRIRQKVLPPNHPDLALGLQNLAGVLMDNHKLQEAEGDLQKAVDILKSNKGDPLEFAIAQGSLGMCLRDEGKLPQAEIVLRDALKTCREKLPPRHPQTAKILSYLGSVLRQLKKSEEVEDLAREALSIEEEHMPNTWHTFNSKALLGLVLYEQKKYDEAETYMLAGYEGMKQTLDTMPSNAKRLYLDAARRLVKLYEATGQEEKRKFYEHRLAEITAQLESPPTGK